MDYICRLVMRVPGDTPGDAPVAFVRHLVEGGLVTWIFRVEDVETHEILGYFDGNGIPVDIEAIMAEADEDVSIEDVSLPDISSMATPFQVTVDTNPPSDEELNSLAESLNETEQL